MSRVLVLSLLFAPDGVSTATIVSALAQDLTKLGHDVDVIAALPHYNEDPDARAAQPLTKKLGGLYHRSDYHGIPVWHTPIVKKSRGAAGRMLGYLLYNAVSLLLGLFALKRPDVILVVSPPLTAGPVGWLLAVLRRSRVVYNVQELYPDAFLHTGFREASFVIRVFRWIERFVYKRSHGLTPISQSFAETLMERGAKPERVHVIPNFVDIDEIQPGQKDNPLARDCGLVDKFVALYAGNIGMTQSFHTVLDAAEYLKDTPDIHFLLVGNGTLAAELAAQIQQRHLTNITMLPYQPRSRVPHIYATGDLGLIPLMAGVAKTTLPSKLYTIMASGRPVLATVEADSDMGRLINGSESGVTVPPEDANALADAIRNAYNNRDNFRQYGANGREYVENHYARMIIAQKYHKLFESLAQ